MKKIFRTFVIMFTIFLVVNCGTMAISAVNTVFSTEALSDEEKNTFISNTNISMLTEEPLKKGIRCFDVNENGMFVIAQNGSRYKTICVYSADGIFQYGYTFEASQSFAVEWSNLDINIYFVRSDVILTITSTGNTTDVAKVQDTSQNNRYRNYLLNSSERTVDGVKYVIQNDAGIFDFLAIDFSKLVKITPSEEAILYDAGTNYTFFGVIALLASFVIVAIFIFVRYIKPQKN